MDPFSLRLSLCFYALPTPTTRSLLPEAGAHSSAFLYTSGHIPSCLGSQPGGSLLLRDCLWDVPATHPSFLIVTSMIQEQWADFLPLGCIKKLPWNQQNLKLTESGARMTQKCQQNNSTVSRQWKNRCGIQITASSSISASKWLCAIG